MKLSFLPKRKNSIDSLNDTYCIRTKSNVAIHIDNYEDSDMIETIADIEPTFSKSRYFDSVQIF